MDCFRDKNFNLNNLQCPSESDSDQQNVEFILQLADTPAENETMLQPELVIHQ
jgi:hypothetical protein